MTRFGLFLMAIMAAGSVAAQNAPLPAKPGAPPVASPLQQEAQAILVKVQTLLGQQHYFDALQELDKAEALVPDNPVLTNVRGSIYTATRDFDKARACFEKSEKLLPGAFEPRFNLAELLYVQESYGEAENAFVALLKEFPRLREEVRHLTQFKVIVCRLKQNKVAEAEEVTKNFTFMDDTPAYYYTKAAFSFQKSDKDDAKSWIAKAMRIFNRTQNSPYIDTLMEARWVNSLGVPPEGAEAEKTPEGGTGAKPDLKPGTP
jgi:tetratricopeptide (TPR) repeat protein